MSKYIGKMKLEDDSPMPFGKHKGEQMEDVPGNYLMYLFKETSLKNKDVKDYIEENYDIIVTELTKEEKVKFDV